MKNILIFTIVAGVVVAVLIKYFVNEDTVNLSSTIEITPASEAYNVGKYAYNKTNGVYQGKIVSYKSCNTDSSLMCYEIDQGEEYSRKIEHPISNVVVRDSPPK